MAKNNDRWPKPPVDQNGAPKSWVVATKAFNNAAQIGMSLKGDGWELDVKRLPHDQRACYLIGYYDEAYRSFHIDRQFTDGSRERVYDPAQSRRPAPYETLLGIMNAWQMCAKANGWQEVNRDKTDNLCGFDPFLDKKLAPR